MGLAEAGDYVLAPDGSAIGRVESVLSAASGDRLLIARAFSRGGYVFAPLDEVVATTVDGDLGLRWHTLSVSPEAVLARGLFRREMGRLIRDPRGDTFGAPRQDAIAEADLRAALAAEPLTADAEIDAAVRRGVAVLDGVTGTVASKVIAERVARLTPGIWDAVNRVAADEELGGGVRARLRRDTRLAAAVKDVTVSRGLVTIVRLPDATSDAKLSADLERTVGEVQGVRGVVLA